MRLGAQSRLYLPWRIPRVLFSRDEFQKSCYGCALLVRSWFGTWGAAIRDAQPIASASPYLCTCSFLFEQKKSNHVSNADAVYQVDTGVCCGVSHCDHGRISQVRLVLGH